jgi:hypothetical protein
VERGVDLGDPWVGVDARGLQRAVRDQADRPVPGPEHMESYLAAAVSDVSHREVVGPLLNGGGASGVVLRRGALIASWGDPAGTEMAFSATKSVLALVAGVAFDVTPGDPLAVGAREGRLVKPEQPVVWLVWSSSNDVRVNLAALALTALLGRPLPEVLQTRVMEPIGASSSWSWHGYANSVVDVDNEPVQVVSGGGHWGGGLWISALDLARIGHLTLRGGRWGGEQVISRQWAKEMWTPCRVKPNYGLSWWLNDDRTVWPAAPATGRCARGNGGAHLLWVDPARDLVISSRWGAQVETLLEGISAAVQPNRQADWKLPACRDRANNDGLNVVPLDAPEPGRRQQPVGAPPGAGLAASAADKRGH